jgi:RNA recognition motif-containing protein
MAYSGNGGVKTLWVGGLEGNIDENFLYSMFAEYKSVLANVKIIRDKTTGQPAGYVACFK